MASPLIIFMGAPGAGKGTQSELLAQSTGWKHISTGELVRSSDDPALLQVANRGELIDSASMQRLLIQAFKRTNPDQPVVLDGFPRLTDEQQWLDNSLPDLGRQITKVIFISVDEAESHKRLLKRGRDDDMPEALNERWQEFSEDTLPVVEEYRKRGLVHEIDGLGTPEAVSDRIEAVL